MTPDRPASLAIFFRKNVKQKILARLCEIKEHLRFILKSLVYQLNLDCSLRSGVVPAYTRRFLRSQCHNINGAKAVQISTTANFSVAQTRFILYQQN